MSFTLRCHPALVVREHDITILRYLASLSFGPIQLLKSTCGFRNMSCFTGKGYWPFAQPPTWRARCCSSSDLSPGTCPARLNLPGTAVPADIASRVTKARKPPHHNKMGRFAVNFNCKKLRFSYTISLFVRSKYPISGINVLYAVLRYLFYLNIPFTEIS